MDLILGVTGGSGCGKSAFCRALAALGAEVLDADEVARQTTRPGEPALREIACAFGEQYLSEDGQLNRKKLGAVVFSDEKKLHRLTEITHKYIIKEIKRQLAEQKSGLHVLDAPLLFESGLDRLCGRTVCVLSGEENRIRRLIRRDRLDREAALERIRAQQPDAFYFLRADDVIRNDWGEDVLRETAKNYWNRLEKEV